jgi:Asp-tRNA(Asn)/Glu-tRNA(Gln) amidotransferase A subunit family amidase
MHTDLCYLDATKLASLIGERRLSPVVVVRAHLERISSVNPRRHIMGFGFSVLALQISLN